VHILGEFGIENADCTLDGYLEGYVIPAQSSAREALEPLLEFFNAYAIEEQGRLVFRQTDYADRKQINTRDLLQETDGAQKVNVRDSELELPSEVIIKHSTVFEDYEQRATKSRRLDGASDRQISIQLPAVMSEVAALERAEKRLRQDWVKRKTCTLAVPNKYFDLSPGDVVSFENNDEGLWVVNSKETGTGHEIEMVSHMDLPVSSSARLVANTPFVSFPTFGQPLAIMMDLPLPRSTEDGRIISHLATYADPWGSAYAVFSSPSQDGFKRRGLATVPSTFGTLLAEVDAGPLGLLDKGNHLHVELLNNNFQSVDLLGLFNGANLLAVEVQNGEYELLQFQTAELQQDGTWILSSLLRAHFGTERAMQSGLLEGANVVAVDGTLTAIEMDSLELGLAQNWRIGPARDPVASDNYLTLTHANTRKSGRMLSPVHLRAQLQESGDVLFSWIRRGRFQSDTWENAEIPLDANTELYQLNILDMNGVSKRQVSLTSSNFEYGLSDQQADLGTTNSAFQFQVAQIGDNGLPGSSAIIQVSPQS